jgi:hypothetical protein
MVTLVNRAKVATTSTGTGTITLGAAESGYQSFADAGVVNSDVVRYTIEDGDAWEIGTGGINAAVTTMSRTLIESSTGSKLNLSGEAVVYVTATGEDIQQPPSEGAFVDGDKTKLDGIEAGATADQTAAEIKTAYESNADTNEFSDAEQSKLAGIEAGATADQTKADIDALNVDADTLDGQHGSYYTSYADTAVANIVDSAPGTLDTLNELAAALGDDPNFATTTTTNIGTKANKTITVSAGSGLTGGGDLTANRTISHADTSTVSDVNGSGNTFIQDIGFDTYGHVTSVGTGTVTVGDGAMTVTAGSGLSGGGQLGTANQSGASSVTVSHADTSSQASVDNSGRTYIQDITLDTYGHITGIASATETVVNTDTTYSAGSGLNLAGTTFSVTDAPKWTTARTLSLTGDASGSVSWDGSGNATLSVNIADATVLSQGGDITGSTDWDDFINSTEASWNNVLNFAGANGPSGAYTYGTALSFSDSFRNAFQLYAPENASNGGGLRYRTTWNNASRPWVEIWDSGNDGSGSGLDADLLDGYHLTSQNRNNQANRVVRTQGNGYAEFGWINTLSGDTTLPLSRIFVDTGDGYIRKSTLAHVASQLPIAAGGKVLQVVSATKTDTSSTSSTGFVDISGLSVSITPSATSSKILVMYSVSGTANIGNSGVKFRLLRGSTGIYENGGMSFQGSSVNSFCFVHQSAQTLDSPSTTSATTYKLQFANTGGTTSYINRTENNVGKAASSITVMEIGA